MAKENIARYVWLIDVLKRYKRLTREEINFHWMKSHYSGGEPMPLRSFYHYRRVVEDNFKIEIGCDNLGRYYIVNDETAKRMAITNWMLDSYALSSALTSSQIPPDRIEIEEVPSAREFLPMVLEAIHQSRKIVFSYAGFNRSRVEKDILFSPCFLKLYKQRWYMIGVKGKTHDVRTYALDRVRAMIFSDETFSIPPSLNLEDLFGNVIGVSTSHAEVKTVKLMVTPMQAKYFRVLPLHASQQEEVHDDYSIFTYRLKLNFELVHEILGLGDAVKVMEPPELRAMVVTQLRNALSRYEPKPN